MCFKLPESITAQNGNTHNLPSTWYLYIVENRLGHLYTGITTNPQRRIKQHNGLLVGGAKALKGKAPIVYKVLFDIGCRKRAAQLEYEVKQFSGAQKRKIVKTKMLLDNHCILQQFYENAL